MEIIFKTNKLKKVCENFKKLQKKYGNVQSILIVQRINELQSAENLEDIFKLPQARLHKLKGNWKDHFSVDIKHPYRLIISPLCGTENYKNIIKIQIVDIIDYH